MNPTHKHVGQLNDRTASVTIKEEPTRIVFEVRFSKLGPGLDPAMWQRWSFPFTLPYENDRRTQVWRYVDYGVEMKIEDLRT